MKHIMKRRDIRIELQDVHLKGILTVPEGASAMVIFSHGSGSSRLSSRNNYVASALSDHQFATLLFDLLTEEEDLVYRNRFNIELLTQRLVAVTDWLVAFPEFASLPLGYFGASTGAASALKAAALLGKRIRAVVSRGGRPDLAGTQELSQVTAPVLLIVGGYDRDVLALNRTAFNSIQTIKQLEIVEHASHLFEEPGKLQEVTQLSIAWFDRYLNE